MGDAPLFLLTMIAVAWLSWWISDTPPGSGRRSRPEQRAVNAPPLRRPARRWSPFDMREPPPPAPADSGRAAPQDRVVARRTAARLRRPPAERSGAERFDAERPGGRSGGVGVRR